MSKLNDKYKIFTETTFYSYLDCLLIAETEVITFGVIICGLSLVFVHIPGFRREGSINPGFINILDHNQSKLGLTLLLQSLGKDEQVSESLR